MSRKSIHIAARIARTLGWILLSLFVLILLIRVLFVAEIPNNFLRKKIVDIANEQLNARVDIRGLKGDLWTEFTIQDLSIAQNDTTLHVSELSARYALLSLLSGTFQIHSVSVKNMSAMLRENTSGKFNVQELINTDGAAETDTAAGSSFKFVVHALEIQNAGVQVHSPGYLPESPLTVRNLNARMAFAFTDEISFSLREFNFKLKEGRLPEPIAISAEAELQDSVITLQQLLIETGNSLLTAQAHTDLADSTLNANIETRPFSLMDLQPFLETDFPENKINISLSASGKMDSLRMRLAADGSAFDHLLLTADVLVGEEAVIKHPSFSARNINLSHFNPALDAHIGEIRLDVQGSLPASFNQTNASLSLLVKNARYEETTLDELSGNATLAQSHVSGVFNLRAERSEIALYPEIKNLFGETPEWTMPVVIRELNPAYFTQNPTMDGSVSLLAVLEGDGFELSEKPWSFKISQNPAEGSFTQNERQLFGNAPARPNTLGGQQFSELEISGQINQTLAQASGHIAFLQSGLHFELQTHNYLGSAPQFSFLAQTENFNIAELSGMEDYTSSITMSIEGKGSHFSLEEMRLAGNINLTSSSLNSAEIDKLNLGFALNNMILTISDGNIESEILAGTFTASKHIQELSAKEDELILDFEIKNLQPLAPFAGFEKLKAEGHINGVLKQNERGNAGFTGHIELENIAADSLFTADAISGQTYFELDSALVYTADVHITSPGISGISLRDLSLQTSGQSITDSVSGILQIDILSRDAGNIIQKIYYRFHPQTKHMRLTWNALNFITPVRTLTLKEPYTVSIEGFAVRTDTLSLVSESGAYLNLAVPFADSLNQHFWLEGFNFDFGVLQEILLGQPYVDGVLSGKLYASNTRDSLFAHGNLRIHRLDYMDVQADSLNFNFNIEDERLQASGNIHMDGRESLSGNLTVPFLPGNPADFDPAFFREQVQGALTIAPVRLNRFKKLLEAAGINQTDGIISFEGGLSGTAGAPVFDGKLSLDEPTLSGIRLDNFFASFSYNHPDQVLSTLAEAHAHGQQVAAIQTNLPFNINFQTFEISTPGPDDTIAVFIDTDNFNLSVFNDFLDKDYLSSLEGVLNADIEISGTLGNLEPRGEIMLTNAKVDVPFTNITLNSIRAEAVFVPGGLAVEEIRMKSGGGTFVADGLIKMEGISPVAMDIRATATQFKLANTNDMNLTINMNTNLTGTPMSPVASGSITIRNGFIYLKNFGEKSVEDVHLEGEEETSVSIYDSLALDMNFIIERNFFVRNERYLDMEVELEGNLEAQKDKGGELQLFGPLTAREGYARPLGKQFNMDEGEFVFSGPIEDPTLNLRTSYMPQTSQKEGNPIVLYYIIEGTAQEPVFRFESDPQMEQQDIIAYTLFGRPFYALDNWQQTMSGGGNPATNLLVDVLLDEVEALATRELGIDVVQIDNTRSGSDAVTSIKTGWYLNRRTFFSILNEISSNPKTLFILEYMLTENLDVIITQGDDNRQGIDLRWQFEY